MKLSKLATLFAIGVLAAALAGAADEKKAAGPPKPGPEVKKLSYFPGVWTSEGEIMENPMGMPAGKTTSADTCSWYSGGFAVICNSKGTGPTGPVTSMGIMSYDPAGKVYTYYGIDSTGHIDQSKGTTDGKTWTYTNEEKMGDKTVYGRYTMSDVTPDSFAFKFETSEDNKNWKTVMDGKSTRTPKAAPAKK